MHRSIRFVLVLGLAVAFCRPAQAKTDRELTYTFNQIWNAAVRFFRVDMRFPVTEKDRKAGYVLFEYKGATRLCHGSFEIVPVERNNRKLTRVRLNIASMPTYVETVLFDKFARKLKEEYGDPPPARRTEPDKPDSSADKDGKTEKGASRDDDRKSDNNDNSDEDATFDEDEEQTEED